MAKKTQRKKKSIYQKSRYYQQKRKRFLLICGILLPLLLLLLVIFAVRSCSHRTPSTQPVPKEADTQTAVSDKEDKKEADTVKEPISLTVSVVGDCTLGTDESFDYSTSLNAYFDSYGKDYFLQNVKDIFSKDDLTIANMEGTLTELDTREEKTFAFKAPPSFAGILSSGSVEAVNMANKATQTHLRLWIRKKSFTSVMRKQPLWKSRASK